MKSHHTISITPYHRSKTCNLPCLIPSCGNLNQRETTVCFKSKMSPSFPITHQLGWQQSRCWRFAEAEKSKKARFLTVSSREDPAQISEKKGSVAGAVALVIGTSIGSGILALPKKTSPAGLLPSSISMMICWAFLLIEALLLVEINVGLLKKKKIKVDSDELEVISIRTMAQETLGEWGGALATMTYVFLGYTSVVAYSAKSGEILYHLTNSPESVSGVFFTALVAILITVGGSRSIDQVNQCLTTSMIGLLIAIEILAVLFGGWSGLDSSSGHWEKVPDTLPVMIFALVYHDLAPVLCAYLEGDLIRIRASILLGSIMPLLALLVWNAIVLGLSNQADQVADPVELLRRWSGVSLMVDAFSLLAVGTSLIGTLLSFSEFFKEQLNNLNLHSPSVQIPEKSGSFFFISNWWKRNRTNFTATVLIIAPSFVASTIVPDAFSAATNFAGGYCMTMLYGVLPPLMALAMNRKQEQEQEQETDQTMISNAGPALVGVGLCAGCLVVEQIIQDLWLLPIN
ncbi:uncharacterized protein LOC142533230 isoform X2 [Primulina tabacum]|uniref:uncharacterized protein LOC142533230 isoform X2 n=1 Tax=Primulina tabacum TaxID=48773 RepID=UPI003F5AC0DD